MAQMRLVYTTAAKLNDLAVLDGQVIYAPDDNIICLDMRNQRFTYKTIRTFDTDAQRLMTTSATPGFYYVDETNVIWRKTLNGAWRQITSGNVTPVFYSSTVQSFPLTGTEGILYYANDGIYRWDPQENKYVLIANANTWDSI